MLGTANTDNCLGNRYGVTAADTMMFVCSYLFVTLVGDEGRHNEMKNPQLRKLEKRDRLLQWIGTFQVTTFSLWCRYEGLVMRGQYPFKHQLIADNLIGILPFALSREAVLMLTPKGKRIAMSLKPELTYAVTHPSKISMSLVPHTLMVQKGIITYHDKSADFVAERQLGFATLRKRPDALIYFDGQLTALEMELTPKYKLRVYCILRHHIAMLMDNHYQHVLYCFDDATTLDFYQRLFNDPEWPVVIYHRQHRRYRTKKSEQGEALLFDPGQYRKKFSFRMLGDERH